MAILIVERYAWIRLVPFLDFHHYLIILTSIAIILLSLLLAGCSSSSPLIPNIFLISFSYRPYTPLPATSQVDFNTYSGIRMIVGNARLAARVGYFGICVNVDGGSWLCGNNATALANDIDALEDPLNLVWLANEFKDMIVFPYLIILALIFSFICILILTTFPAWHKEIRYGSEVDVKPLPSRLVLQTALSIILIASVLTLVSVLWQHTASVAASTLAWDLGNGSVLSVVGATAMVLGWFGFTLFIIVTLGLLVMILSIREIYEPLPSPTITTTTSGPPTPVVGHRPISPVVGPGPPPAVVGPGPPPAVVGPGSGSGRRPPPAVVGPGSGGRRPGPPPAVVGPGSGNRRPPPAVVGRA